LNQSHNSAANAAAANLNLPARSNIKRAKMIYNCKFGEFGVNEGQFTEPSGVCINSDNDIIVADTNSHRIQIFDADGRFKFKFGECGKREGQLLYPNRVAVVKSTGDIVVTERSPTHQIQIYNQYGTFLRKFGASILQHPRGVCVDSKNRIIVVECKVMRVIIFDLMGNILHKFNCSKYLEFPNGCCCSNDREEIFISDNRAHCIKVFNYEGQYLRQIGGEGVTNYPIGVGINSNGEVLVADNHNNFNLTVFTQDGELITALESKVKHAQCFDVGLMDDGSIVLASKDYRIYVYRYNGSNPSNMIQISSDAANPNQITVIQ
jgi:tripartite motif-containing protein 2/3